MFFLSYSILCYKDVRKCMAIDCLTLCSCCLLQDPIHYPHGTKFMAPGPMGQCFPIPDDEDVKRQMITTAENQRKIYRMYNFDFVTKVSMHQFSPLCTASHLSLNPKHQGSCTS